MNEKCGSSVHAQEHVLQVEKGATVSGLILQTRVLVVVSRARKVPSMRLP